MLTGFCFSLRIIASFVLLANGLYIGLGAAYPVGDALSLIMFGSPRWLLAVFGIACMVAARRTLRPVIDRKDRPESVKSLLPYFLLSLVLAVIGLIFFGKPHA
ncbi:MAG: hypothetical protein R3B67_02730 [Phycisphaerales bacterium]